MADSPARPLADLYTFDPKIFIDSDPQTQTLCNLILGCALFYNDTKDIGDTIDALLSIQPTTKPTLSAEWGEYAGRDFHILRYQVGLLRELFVFIREQEETINSSTFKEIVRRMEGEARNAWQTLIDVSLEKPTAGSIGQILIRLRNTIAFHHDPKQLENGFRRHFIDKDKVLQKAFISRGQKLSNTRFYFADAAVQGSISEILAGMKKEEFQMEIINYVKTLTLSLFQLIDRFIQWRGGAYHLHPVNLDAGQHVEGKC